MKRKKGKVIRDMYDGKIINDDEAISKRNIDLVIEKEGKKEKPQYVLIVMLCLIWILAFPLFVSAENHTNVTQINITNPVTIEYNGTLNINDVDKVEYTCRLDNELCVNMNDRVNTLILFTIYVLSIVCYFLILIPIFRIFSSIVALITGFIFLVSGFNLILSMIFLLLATITIFGDA